jgi:tetratricopeptide (TPR) repeat protein
LEKWSASHPRRCYAAQAALYLRPLSRDNRPPSDPDEVDSGPGHRWIILRIMTSKAAPSTLVEDLERALVRCDTRSSFALLNVAFAKRPALELRGSDSMSLLLCMAQWTDLGYRDIAFLDGLTVGLPGIDRAQLTVIQFLKLKMFEAYRHLAAEELEQSIAILDLVLRIGDNLLGNHLFFLANFWKGRAHRKRGDYEQALLHISLARAAGERAKAPKLVAMTKIHESWLAFQNGERQYAFQLLDEAERALRSTGHALSLGNIESARGRFVRRSGEYTRALGHFEAAIAIYQDSCPEHPNLARALVNAAYVKRLIALDLQPRGNGGHAIGATHAKSLKLAREALDLLEQAGRIYALHHHQGGTGSVLVNAAHLHLESGDIDRASTEGRRAFDLGEEKSDQILMARAKIVLSAVELVRSEEQLGERPDVALHANLAVQYAEKAIDLALHTQNKRLLAEAYIARGMAAAADYFQGWEIAKEYAGKAGALLSRDDRDHLYKVLGDLKAKLVGATRVEETLRLWSDGQLGNKTFQQIQEEFAELVIPKVWLQSGKNVTSVSKSLSISPKKVRRILRNAKHGMS